MSEDSFVMFNRFNDDPNKITILHQNIRSLRENFNSLKIFLDSLAHLPDVICLTEIWISECELTCYTIDGYNQFANCSTQRAGGTAVFVSVQFQALSTTLRMLSADAIKITFDLDRDVSLSVISIYRLHSGTVPVFLEELEQILFSCKDKNVIIVGDMNLCILENTQNVYDYQLLMSTNGFDQLVNTPTRGRRCLDHIYLRARDKIIYSTTVIPSGRSDHDLVVCNLRLDSCDKSQLLGNDIHLFKKIDYDMLNQLLKNTNWDIVFQQTNVSCAYDTFLQILKQVISLSTFVKRRVSGIKLLKPWITVELCQRQKYRNKLYKKFKKSPHNLRLARHFHCFSNKLKQDMNKQKESYYLNLFCKNKKDVKKQWLTVDEIIGLKSKHKQLDLIRAYEEPHDLVQGHKQIATEFNNYFISVINDLRNNLDNTINFDSNSFNTNFPLTRVLDSFFITPTDINEVSNIIKSLNSNKCPGIDGISAFLLKVVNQHISHVLTYIFNLSFESGMFPESLKTAIVIPLFKKGDKTDINNFRPISLLSCFSKILEKIVKKRLLNFLNKNNFFSQNQFGFIEKKSTEDALLKFFKEIFDGLNSSSVVAGIFVDITKAFDSVDYDIMLLKLENAGIRGLPLSWFRSYLCNRMQCVRVNDQLSSCVSIPCGVPQGSVLGPILFIIYINNLCSGRFFGKLTCFADDTALSYSVKSVDELGVHMQSDLNFLKLWFTKSKMALSSKTKFIRFNFRSKNEPQCNIYFKCSSCLLKLLDVSCSNCVNIEQVSSIKYLGIVVDENCNWKEHISLVRVHMYKFLRKIYYLKFVCPISVLKSVYYALVNSKLQYGIVFWGGTYFSSVKSICIAQKKIIRQVFRVNRYEHTFPLFKKLGILPLRHFFVYRTMRAFFIRGGQTISNSLIYSDRLRSRNMVVLPKANFEAFKRSFTFISLRIFNKLPLNVTNSMNLNTFLKELKFWLFTYDNCDIEHFLWQ